MSRHATLNRIYRLVWSAAHNAWVVVAEVARGRGKSSGRRKLLAPACAVAFTFGGGLAQAGPTGGQVTAGSGSISQSGATTTIRQNSQNLSLNWQSFNVGKQETVNFVQPSASALAVNRIYDTAGSQIMGRLNANGQVWLINPNGVLFGQSAQVNVGGLVASTLELTASSADGQRATFSGRGTGSVINQGSLTAASGGYIALIGKSVANTGSISAPQGTAALGAGSAVTLNFNGNSLASLQVDQNLLDALAENGGLIQAEGGQVLLSAGARDSLISSVVNNTGVIEARTVENRDGKIVLLAGMSAGTTNLAGRLDASAPDGGKGGFIETSGAKVTVADEAQVTTQAANGQTGTWLIDPTDFTVSAGSAPSTGSGIGASTLATNLGTNNVTLTTENGSGSDAGDIHVNANVSWTSNNTLMLSAYRNINLNASISASAGTLKLHYGQGSTDGSGSGYALNGGSINLSAGNHFYTQQGRSGTVTAWTVITSLGAAGSTTGTDLQGISGNSAGNYVLGANIDASATSGWNGGAGFNPIGNSANRFTGRFDGLGHTISGLTIKRASTACIGLFGYTGSGASIANLGLTDVRVQGSAYVGGLAGVSLGVINNVYATGSVSGDYGVGGLVGLNDGSGKISNVYATGSVSGNHLVGGLVGLNFNSGTISNAYATGSVSGSNDVGGLVGLNAESGTISNAYATGSVSGTTEVGGLVGGNYNSGKISNAYATGSVSGASNVGGVAGNNIGTITNGFFDTTTSSRANGCGGGGGACGVSGKTTAQLAAALPAGFDAAVWGNGGNQTTPYLLSHGVFNTAGPVYLGSDGAATPTAYDVILNVNQLQAVKGNLSAHYVLGNDVDASATATWNAGAGFSPISGVSVPFTGTFDGLGHTVSKLSINRPTSDFVGLFGGAQSGAIIRNLGLVESSVTGRDYVGGLAGSSSSTISNAFVTGSVTGRLIVGGLAGANVAGTITNSYASATVTADSYVGGLLGANSSTLSNVHATGSVTGFDKVGGLVGVNAGTTTYAYATGRVTSSASAGGLVGENDSGTISFAYATGDVKGGDAVGGLVGLNRGAVSNAYATGHATGNAGVGGLVGYGYLSSVSNVYATGTAVGGRDVGGLVGINDMSSITNAYWDTTTSATSSATGYNSGTLDKLFGLDTAAMHAAASFSAWGGDISNAGGSSAVWRIYDGATYPLLRHFLTPLSVTATSGTRTYNGTTAGLGVSYSAVPNANLLGVATSVATSKNVGSQALTVSGLYSNQQGYDVSYVSGTLSITPAHLTGDITAAGKTYDGTTAATTAGSLAGVVSGDAVA
ncbi:filamentous hemagglutinin N-terminal domain-containing protein, partial [Niveibacterium sp. 24ML]|uniref:two-partner secretion domain-containing protein n=1 Tax=Niveibacterium sp. 24ML TaxID=2985512 RepID=UPI002270A340